MNLPPRGVTCFSSPCLRSHPTSNGARADSTPGAHCTGPVSTTHPPRASTTQLLRDAVHLIKICGQKKKKLECAGVCLLPPFTTNCKACSAIRGVPLYSLYSCCASVLPVAMRPATQVCKSSYELMLLNPAVCPMTPCPCTSSGSK